MPVNELSRRYTMLSEQLADANKVYNEARKMYRFHFNRLQEVSIALRQDQAMKDDINADLDALADNINIQLLSPPTLNQ